MWIIIEVTSISWRYVPYHVGHCVHEDKTKHERSCTVWQITCCTHVYVQADITLLTDDAHSSIRRFIDSLPPALKQLTYQPILFDFRIWSKCQFTVCIGQLIFFYCLFSNMKSYFKLLYQLLCTLLFHCPISQCCHGLSQVSQLVAYYFDSPGMRDQVHAVMCGERVQLFQPASVGKHHVRCLGSFKPGFHYPS